MMAVATRRRNGKALAIELDWFIWIYWLNKLWDLGERHLSEAASESTRSRRAVNAGLTIVLLIMHYNDSLNLWHASARWGHIHSFLIDLQPYSNL